MTEKEYNFKKEELKILRRHLFDIRVKMEQNKLDDKKYNMWREVLIKAKRELAKAKLQIKEYEIKNEITK